MSRLSRFEDYRFVGTRDTMRVYDCDDPDEFDELEARLATEDLLNRTLLQAFAPDTVDEARNRGFTPYS
ncbi:MAG: hypothetical protein ACRDU9_02440 [Acidimicrobiia bacterium]